MAERSPSVRLTRWDYVFRALTIFSVLLYAFVVYDNLVHSFTNIYPTYSLLLQYYALFVVTPSLLLVSGLIVWRAPGNNVGRYLLLFVIGIHGFQFSFEVGSPQLASFLVTAFLIYQSGCAYPSFIYLMLSFPTGHIFPPGWRRWVVVFALVKFLGVVLEFMVLPSSDAPWGPVLEKYGRLLFFPSLVPLQPLITLTVGSNGVLLLLGFIAGIVSIVLRYRASKPNEREQIKWVVWSFGIFALTIPGISAVNLIPSFASVATTGALFAVGAGLVIVIVSIGISILRYHLFDIDIIIRRTLIYSLLTAALALIYFVSVVLLQQLFRAVTGQTSEIAIIVSTLGIAALFVPFRRRVQNTIDRRFYRRKYDAQKVLAEFARTARDETDLNKLTQRLVEVVDETMQPESVSLWLKPTRPTDGRPTVVAGQRKIK